MSKKIMVPKWEELSAVEQNSALRLVGVLQALAKKATVKNVPLVAMIEVLITELKNEPQVPMPTPRPMQDAPIPN